MMQVQAIRSTKRTYESITIRKFQAGGIIFVLFGEGKNGSSNRSRYWRSSLGTDNPLRMRLHLTAWNDCTHI
jgi:hypothetical protein